MEEDLLEPPEPISKSNRIIETNADRVNFKDEEFKWQLYVDVIQQNCQSYFNWIDNNQYEEGGVTGSEFIGIIQDRFLEVRGHQEVALKFNSTETIGDKGSQAYTNVFVKNNSEAKAALAEARSFIHHCAKKSHVHQDRLSGFNYVFDCLELHIDMKAKSENREELLEFKQSVLPLWEKLPKYESLNPKSKAAILALKYHFYGKLRKDKKEQFAIAVEMIQLDPDYYEWHLCKAALLGIKRRAERYEVDQPLEPIGFGDEAVEILLAKSLSPNHPLCNLEYCQFLAELARSKRTFQDWKIPLEFGTKKFFSCEDLAIFLNTETEKILGVYDQSERVNSTIANIFMKWLPPKYRNLNLAENCLQYALALHPKSSKAHHRLASFYMITAINQTGMADAERHCLSAVQFDPRNFPARAELIQILLGNPEKNEAKLNEIFDKYLKESHFPLTLKNKSDLYFYKGLLLQLKPGFQIEAIENWIISQEITKREIQFNRLNFIHYRYKWPLNHVSYPKIRRTLKYALEDPEFSRGKTEVIAAMMDSLDRAEEFEKVELKKIEERKRIQLENQAHRGGGFRGRALHGRGRGNTRDNDCYDGGVGYQYNGNGKGKGDHNISYRGNGFSTTAKSRGSKYSDRENSQRTSW